MVRKKDVLFDPSTMRISRSPMVRITRAGKSIKIYLRLDDGSFALSQVLTPEDECVDIEFSQKEEFDVN